MERAKTFRWFKSLLRPFQSRHSAGPVIAGRAGKSCGRAGFFLFPAVRILPGQQRLQNPAGFPDHGVKTCFDQHVGMIPLRDKGSESEISKTDDHEAS